MYELKHFVFRKDPKKLKAPEKLKQGTDRIPPQRGKAFCQLTHLCSCTPGLQLKLAASWSLGASLRVFWGQAGLWVGTKSNFTILSPLKWNQLFLWTAVMICSIEKKRQLMWLRAMLLPTSGFELSWRIKGLWIEVMASFLYLSMYDSDPAGTVLAEVHMQE